MGRTQVTVFDALAEVINEKNIHDVYDDPQCGKLPITQSEFNSIMMLTDITQSIRKMNDFWKLIGDLGLLQRINQSDKYFLLLDNLYIVMARGRQSKSLQNTYRFNDTNPANGSSEKNSENTCKVI